MSPPSQLRRLVSHQTPYAAGINKGRLWPRHLPLVSAFMIEDELLIIDKNTRTGQKYKGKPKAIAVHKKQQHSENTLNYILNLKIYPNHPQK
ncbi:hypothetical protein BC938DRAFT_477017 [Jimgerdemannia flammicorona]|uniref:Uncharacterized protein n=1 Tax=Jimgerdemannia flammicorona TaxID=994334 RepID=A0A433QPV4_9FUNG|nr:hypothetical protein BC938DRAFT_477017 [Jimgerdemannia flammicorona]